MSDRAAARWERILEDEGMPAELPGTPSWRAPTRRHLVSLPADREGGQPTVADRAANFVCDARHVPVLVEQLLDLYWRGDWSGFPAWHRPLVWAVAHDGQTVANFCRTRGGRRLPYLRVWRALEQHKRRAGIGGAGMANEQKQGPSRAEITKSVRVKAVFSEKLPLHLGLGNISYAEGELVAEGRFVRIDFPSDRKHQHHDHVLIPVGPGVSIAVLKE